MTNKPMRDADGRRCDPKVTSSGISLPEPDLGSPQLGAAKRSCQKLLPNGGAGSPAEAPRMHLSPISDSTAGLAR
jgi:hypothetical protein